MVYKVDAKQRKSPRIIFRVTEEEKAHLVREAETHGVTVSNFARSKTLGAKIVSRVDSQAIAELRRQGGLLKHLANTDKVDYQDIKAILEKIEATIEELGGGA